MLLEVLVDGLDQLTRQPVAQDRQRTTTRAAEPFEVEHRLSRRGPQLLGDCGCGLLHGVAEHARGRPLTGSGQVVVEAGELDLASNPPVHHLGAHATLADEQPLVDQLLDRLPHRRPGQAELVGQGDLALEPVAGLERPGLDRLLDLGGHL